MKKGAIFTEEHRKKLSESAKRRKIHGMQGKHHSEETKKKIGIANIGRDSIKNLGEYAQKGSIPWNKGIKYNDELKAKLDMSGLKMDGFHGKHTDKSKAKMSRSRRGKKNPLKSAMNKLAIGEKAYNWKGGVTSQTRLERGRFLREVQRQIFERDNYTCQICDQYSGYLHADHIKSWADYPELRFEIDNCRTLCRACHYYITFKRKMPIGSLWGLNSPLDKKGG